MQEDIPNSEVVVKNGRKNQSKVTDRHFSEDVENVKGKRRISTKNEKSVDIIMSNDKVEGTEREHVSDIKIEDEVDDLLNVDVNLSSYSNFEELSYKIQSYFDNIECEVSSDSDDDDKDEIEVKSLRRNGTPEPQKSLKRKRAFVKKFSGNSTNDSIVVKSQLQNVIPKPRKKRKKENTKGPIERLKVSTGFLWHAKDIDASLRQTKKDDESSDDDDVKEEQKVVESKVKSKKRSLKERLEEKDLFKTEHLLMDPERKPETADDFDKLVLSSPNSSLVWLKYMALHLQSAEFDKARVVAERALKTISFREEKEKLNVWVAYLNLENLYGTTQSLKKVLDRALTSNKPYTIYKQMVTIYESTDKIEAAEDVYVYMSKKFKNLQDMWINYGTFLMKNGKSKQAQKVLERALICLPKKEHIPVIVKFASLEFQYGEKQRGKTMFDSVLSSFPKRIDIWFIYTDLVIKSGELETARLIFERMITLKMQVKKMKSIFMKYLKFEKERGSEEMVARVIEKAEKYVGVTDEKKVVDHV